jgi:hypothetical protein
MNIHSENLDKITIHQRKRDSIMRCWGTQGSRVVKDEGVRVWREHSGTVSPSFLHIEVEDDETGCRERNKEDTQQGNVWPPEAL